MRRFGAASGGGGGGGPLVIPAGNLVAGLHMDGANNSTAFPDVTGRTWSSVNGGKIITADSKFGGACGSFINPTSGEGGGELGERITTADAADLRFGSGAWTVAGWIKPQAPLLGFGGFFRKGQNTSDGLSLAITPARLTMRSNGTTDDFVSTTISTSAWSFVAFVYDGTKIHFFVGGAKVGEATRALNITSSDTVVVGRASGDSRYAFRGLIDDLVIVKGLALWTSAFTPPTAPFQIAA